MSEWRYTWNTGWGLIITPTIMFGFLIYAAVSDPRILIDWWQFYLLFIGLPYAAGALILWWCVKHRPEGQ